VAHHYNLWLEYPADWRPLRDFFYEACKCTHFWTGPNTMQQGPPDNQEREHYAVDNEYNLIGLRPPLRVEKPGYVHDVKVWFTLNKFDRWEQWQNEVIDASIRWLARSTGDALLDWDLLPILGRKGAGPIIVSSLAYDNPSQRVLDARRPEYQAFLAATLEREGLAYEVGPLNSIDLTPTPPAEDDTDDDE
jgi:hypothetical protein